MELITRSTNEGQSRVVLLKQEDIPKISLDWRVDEQQRKYLPVCQFHCHPGVVFEGHEVCEKRHCRYYKRLYREESR